MKCIYIEEEMDFGTGGYLAYDEVYHHCGHHSNSGNYRRIHVSKEAQRGN